MWSSGMQGISRDEIAVSAGRVVGDPAGRRGWPVPDSRGTMPSPRARCPGSGSIGGRDPPETPTVGRPRWPAVGTAESQAPPRRRESRSRLGSVRIARQRFATESCPRCGPGYSLTIREMRTPGGVGVPDPVHGSRPDSESRSGLPRVSFRAVYARSVAPHTHRRRRRDAAATAVPRLAVNAESSP